MDTARRGNYESGSDYVLEYGELRFTFNERDFTERVEQAEWRAGTSSLAVCAKGESDDRGVERATVAAAFHAKRPSCLASWRCGSPPLLRRGRLLVRTNLVDRVARRAAG